MIGMGTMVEKLISFNKAHYLNDIRSSHNSIFYKFMTMIIQNQFNMYDVVTPYRVTNKGREQITVSAQNPTPKRYMVVHVDKIRDVKVPYLALIRTDGTLSENIWVLPRVFGYDDDIEWQLDDRYLSLLALQMEVDDVLRWHRRECAENLRKRR